MTVEQRYAANAPLVAGHWLPDDDGTGGPDQAAGQAAVVSGVAARGTRTVLFGTQPCSEPIRRACTHRWAGPFSGRPADLSATGTGAEPRRP